MYNYLRKLLTPRCATEIIYFDNISIHSKNFYKYLELHDKSITM
jgi:hypothetical protein